MTKKIIARVLTVIMVISAFMPASAGINASFLVFAESQEAVSDDSGSTDNELNSPENGTSDSNENVPGISKEDNEKTSENPEIVAPEIPDKTDDSEGEQSEMSEENKSDGNQEEQPGTTDISNGTGVSDEPGSEPTADPEITENNNPLDIFDLAAENLIALINEGKTFNDSLDYSNDLQSITIPAESTITTSNDKFKINGSSDPDNPFVVNIEGEVTVNNTIEINGYVTIKGNGSSSVIKRSNICTGNLFEFEVIQGSNEVYSNNNNQLIIKDCTINGDNISSESTISIFTYSAYEYENNHECYNAVKLCGNTKIVNENCTGDIIKIDTFLNTNKYNSELYIEEGVIITNNTAKSIIGTVDVLACDIYISGGSIIGNTVTQTPVNLYVDYAVYDFGNPSVQKPKFYMSGGNISNNTVTSDAGHLEYISACLKMQIMVILSIFH